MLEGVGEPWSARDDDVKRPVGEILLCPSSLLGSKVGVVLIGRSPSGGPESARDNDRCWSSEPDVIVLSTGLSKARKSIFVN